MNRMQLDSIYLRTREARARVEATEALDHFCQTITQHAADRTPTTAAHLSTLTTWLRASVRHGWRGMAETGALVNQLRDVPLDDAISTIVVSYQALRLLDAVAGYTETDASASV